MRHNLESIFLRRMVDVSSKAVTTGNISGRYTNCAREAELSTWQEEAKALQLRERNNTPYSKVTVICLNTPNSRYLYTTIYGEESLNIGK